MWKKFVIILKKRMNKRIGDPMSDKINLTPEQLVEVKAFFQQNDFTANMAVEREYNMTGEKSKSFCPIKKDFR